MGLVMYSYRTSIGDLDVPNAIVWTTIRGDNQNEAFIVYFLWFIWMIQQYFMLIVFLNFLIAIIGQVYEHDMV